MNFYPVLLKYLGSLMRTAMKGESRGSKRGEWETRDITDAVTEVNPLKYSSLWDKCIIEVKRVN